MMNVKTGTAIMGAILILVSFTSCPAGDSKDAFPKGCSPSDFEFRDNGLILNTTSGSAQSLYLFHNISGSGILLNHPAGEDPGASAGWASMLGADKWSVFAVNKGDFVLSCSVTVRGEARYIPCEKVLTACKFENPAFKRGQSGSYWVVEDKTLEAVLEDTKSRGIGW